MYQAPIDDIRLAMTSAGVDAICRDWPSEIDSALCSAVLDEAAKLAQEVLAPLNASGDREGVRRDGDKVFTASGWREAYRQFAEGGWVNIMADEEFGGQGLPMVLATGVQELFESANMSFSLCPLLTRAAIDAITHHGTSAQRETYLEAMIEGRWSGTMNLTEPQAGSDLAAVRTTASPAADGSYRIKGQKIFITYGEHDMTDNIVHLVLARTPDAPPGVKGISLFIVPKFIPDEQGAPGERNDLCCVAVEHKLGIHASPTCVMSYGDQGGAWGQLIGEEGKGLVYMFTMMNVARHAVGVQGYAQAEAAYQHARRYALDRVQGRGMLAPDDSARQIAYHPDVLRELLSMRAGVSAMRGLAMQCAAAFDRARVRVGAESEEAQTLGALLTPMVKAWSTEDGVSLCSAGVQIHGGMGFIEETGAAQYLRDARITPIYEGTTAIQANDLLGRKFIRDAGQGMSRWLLRVDADLARWSALNNAALNDFIAALRESLATSRALNEQVLVAQDVGRVYAGSVPFLMMHSLVAGAWAIAGMAATALQEGDALDLSSTHREAAVALLGVYASQFLPRADAYAAAVRGAQSVSGFPLHAV